MHALEAELPELPHFLATQQLEIVPYDQWYLTNGRFDAQAVQRQLVSRAESSVQRGFTGIRITGNPSFQRDKQGWARADTYEKTVHELLRDARHFALCTYSSETCEIDRMMETLQRHGGLLMPHQRDWKLIELL